MVARGDLGVELPVHLGAADPEATGARRACGGQAGDRGDADAGIDDRIAGADPGRSVGRGDRDLRRCGCGDAVGGIGGGPLSGRGGHDDEQRRDLGREGPDLPRGHRSQPRQVRRESMADGIVAAAREIAEATNIKAICCFTQSGTTASPGGARTSACADHRADAADVDTARRMALTWGAHCVITEPQDRFKGAVLAAVRAARELTALPPRRTRSW